MIVIDDKEYITFHDAAIILGIRDNVFRTLLAKNKSFEVHVQSPRVKFVSKESVETYLKNRPWHRGPQQGYEKPTVRAVKPKKQKQEAVQTE